MAFWSESALVDEHSLTVPSAVDRSPGPWIAARSCPRRPTSPGCRPLTA